MVSQRKTYAVSKTKIIRTTAVLCWSWSRFGQLTRRSSPRTPRTNSIVPLKRPVLLFSCVLPLPPPLAAVELRLLPIYSSPRLIVESRAGGTRTHDLRFWRPLLFQLSYCPLSTWSPDAPYADGTTGRTSSTGCDPECSAGSYGYCSSGVCTLRKPALVIVAQRSSKLQGRDYQPHPYVIRSYSTPQFL